MQRELLVGGRGASAELGANSPTSQSSPSRGEIGNEYLSSRNLLTVAGFRHEDEHGGPGGKKLGAIGDSRIVISPG